MSLVRWEPFRNVASLQERINRIFDDAFTRSTELDENNPGAWRPAVDIFEDENALVIEAELPGVSKDDISVEVENKILSLKGERKEIREIKEGQYYRKEQRIGRFHRAFTLPLDLDPDRIKANFQNGILRLEIPKSEEQKPRKITINVENQEA